MAFKIEFDPEALKDLKKLDRPIQQRLVGFLGQRVARLDNPREIGEALAGTKLGGYWKYRVGDWRIVCDFQESRIIVRVLAYRQSPRSLSVARPTDMGGPNSNQRGGPAPLDRISVFLSEISAG